MILAQGAELQNFRTQSSFMIFCVFLGKLSYPAEISFSRRYVRRTAINIKNTSIEACFWRRKFIASQAIEMFACIAERGDWIYPVLSGDVFGLQYWLGMGIEL